MKYVDENSASPVKYSVEGYFKVKCKKNRIDDLMRKTFLKETWPTSWRSIQDVCPNHKRK